MSKDEYLITDAPLKALTVFAMPMILGIAKTVSAFSGASVIKYSSFDMILFLHNFLLFIRKHKHRCV